MSAHNDQSSGGKAQAAFINDLLDHIGAVNADDIYQLTGAKKLVHSDGTNSYVRTLPGGAVTKYAGDITETSIQAAVDGLTSGRTWKEKVLVRGTFAPSGKLTLPSYTVLDLTDSQLILADSSDCTMIENSDVTNGNSHIEIFGGILAGNKTNQTGTCYGINVEGDPAKECEDIIIRDIWIDNVKFAGVVLKDIYYARMQNVLLSNIGTTTGEHAAYLFRIYDSHILNTTIETCYDGMKLYDLKRCNIIGGSSKSNTEHGYYVQGIEEVTMSDLVAYDNTLDGFQFDQDGDSDHPVFNTLKNLVAHDNTQNGFNIKRVDKSAFSSLIAYLNGRNGFLIALNNTYNSFTGCHAVTNNQSNGGYSGFTFQDTEQYDTLMNCYAIDDGGGAFVQKYGFNLGASTSHIQIIGGAALANATAQVLNAGSNNVFHKIKGFVTENSGSATMSAGKTSVTVTHGLAGTPDEAMSLTPNWNAGDIWATTGPTTFIIYCENAPVIDKLVQWEAHYTP